MYEECGMTNEDLSLGDEELRIAYQDEFLNCKNKTFFSINDRILRLI
jgi:hypothetical protein